MKKEKQFSVTKRISSFRHAGRGIFIFVRDTHNVRIQLVLFFCAIILGFFYAISMVDWMFLFLVAGLVFVAEAFNTAIEIDMDLTSPEYHPYARDTKDVAAGAVLLASCTALAMGFFIFFPYIFVSIK